MSFLSWLASPPPDAAIEIAPDGVSVAVLGSRGAEAVVQAYGSADLPPGAVTAGAGRAQHRRSRGRRAGAARRLRARRAAPAPRGAGDSRPGRARVARALRPDSGPPRRPRSADSVAGEEVAAVSRGGGVDHALAWRPRSTQAGSSSSWRHGATWSRVRKRLRRGGDPRRARRYCDAERRQSVSGQRCRRAGDWLVVHIRPEYTSIAIMRGSDLIFFRTRAEGDAEPLADVVHQTAMYYQDRLDGQGSPASLPAGGAALAGGVEAACRETEARLGMSSSRWIRRRSRRWPTESR